MTPAIRYYFVTSLATGCLLVLITCSSNPADSNKETTLEELLAQTPRADEEAELMALWATNDLVAPSNVYFRIIDGLDRLRKQYADSLPELMKLRFSYPQYVVGRVENLMTADATDEVIEGSYIGLDSINAFYSASVIDTLHIVIPNESKEYLFLTSETKKRINPLSLPAEYSKVNGVQMSGPAPKVDYEANVLPGLHDGNLVFLYRNYWGDCCISHEYHYFKQDGNGFKLIGYWLYDASTSTGLEPKPEWFDEARIALQGFRKTLGEQPLPHYLN